MEIRTMFEMPKQLELFDGCLKIDVRSECTDDAALYLADGELVFTDPFFEPQPRLDPHEGFSFEMKLPKPEKLLAVYQHKSWWVRPAFPESTADIPEKTQMLLLKYPEGTVCLVAAAGKVFRTDFEAGASDDEMASIRIRTSSNRVGDSIVHTPLFAAASDLNPYEAIRKAELVLGASGDLQIRENRAYPEIFEGFGWCTWDAFYRDVSEEGIIAKLEELKEKQVPVRWVLIDDGWIDADYDRLTISGFDAVKEKFPNGLAGTVKLIKEKYGVKYVGVWHATFGYWCGVTPGSEAEKVLGEFCQALPDGRLVTAPDAEKAFRFYDAWHSYLKGQGIDFVKVDNQSAISVLYDGIASYGASKEILAGLERSVEKNFGGAIINCMGMAPQELWARKTTALTRTSDDFVPNTPEGFIEHAMQNSYNSLWSGTFYTGDWDMFFTEHVEARMNAVLRAVSGGPVYVSDKVGKTDPEYLRPLMDENGTIKRCTGVGLPSPANLFEDPRKSGILKVVNYTDDSICIGAFDLVREAESVIGLITMADVVMRVPGADAEAYAVRGVFGGDVGKIDYRDPYAFELPKGGAELFILKPLVKQG